MYEYDYSFEEIIKILPGCSFRLFDKYINLN